MKHLSDAGSHQRRPGRGISSLRRAVSATVESLENRLLFAAGDLDSTFGDPTDAGKARITITQAAVPDRANAVGILPDGRILVVGQSGNPSAATPFTQFGVARLNANGFPDETFGNKGRIAQTFSGPTASATAILTGTDNKPALFNGDIVIGGYANTNGTPTLQFAMARYTPDGTLDPAWPNGGRVLTSFAEDARLSALLLQQDTGAMIGVGTVGNGTDDQLALVRFNADGTVDTTFGTAGDGTVLSGIAGQAHAAAFLAGGQIAVAGKAADGSAVVAVFDPAGNFIGSFEDANLAGANGLAVLPDNTLLLAGPTSTALRPLDSDFAVVHRGADGTTDTTFGGGDGVATMDITGSGANDDAAGVAITTPGASGNFQIVVAGSTNIQRSGTGAIVGSDFAVARLSSNGLPDTAFGNKGAVAQPFGLFDSEGVRTHAMGNAVAVQPDGNIVVAGAVPAATLQPTGGGQRGVVERFGLARFLGAGADVGTASISGTFYNDLNRNGQRDAGEPAMAGMTAYFDANDNAQPDPGEPKATAGADGRYSIAGLPAGQYYRIREVRGLLTRTQPAGTFPLGYYDVTLAAGQQSDGNDFGNFDPSQAGPSTNAAPVANNDSASATQDDSVDINVLGNDSDDNPVKLLTVTVSRQPAHGVAVFNPATRVITYTPAEGYTGDDSFAYRLTDTGNKNSADATVSLTVAPATPPATINAMISSAVLPPSVVGGGKAKASITVLIANKLTQFQTGTATIDLFASSDDALDTNDIQILTLAKTIKLKPAGGSKTIRMKIASFPAVARDGAYHMLAKVTGPDGTSTVAEAQPMVTIAHPFTALTPTITAPFPKPVSPGGKGTAAIQLANSGNIPAVGPATIALFASPDPAPGRNDQLISMVPLKLKVKNGRSHKYKLKALLPQGIAPGSYYLVANVDFNDGTGNVGAGGNSAVSGTPFTVV